MRQTEWIQRKITKRKIVCFLFLPVLVCATSSTSTPFLLIKENSQIAQHLPKASLSLPFVLSAFPSFILLLLQMLLDVSFALLVNAQGFIKKIKRLLSLEKEESSSSSLLFFNINLMQQDRKSNFSFSSVLGALCTVNLLVPSRHRLTVFWQLFDLILSYCIPTRAK